MHDQTPSLASYVKPSRPVPRVLPVSPRQGQVLAAMVESTAPTLHSADIAARTGISVGAVRVYIHHLMRAYGVATRLELVEVYRRALRGVAAPEEVMSLLAPREREVCALAVRGASTHEIATELGISPHTARHHLGNIYRKVRVYDTTSLAALYWGGEAYRRPAPDEVVDYTPPVEQEPVWAGHVRHARAR